MWLRLLSEREKPIAMASTHDKPLTALLQAVARVLADCFQHPVTLAAVVWDDQRLVNESSQQIKHVTLRNTVAGGDRFRRRERPSAHEYREPTEEYLLRLAEKL